MRGALGRGAQPTQSNTRAQTHTLASLDDIQTAELIWNWAKIYGDTLYMAVEDLGGTDPDTGRPRPTNLMGRRLYTFDLAQSDMTKDMRSIQMLVRALARPRECAGICLSRQLRGRLMCARRGLKATVARARWGVSPASPSCSLFADPPSLCTPPPAGARTHLPAAARGGRGQPREWELPRLAVRA